MPDEKGAAGVVGNFSVEEYSEGYVTKTAGAAALIGTIRAVPSRRR